MTNTFKSLGLIDELLRAITDQGYTEPTSIQQQAIPIILEKRDLMGRAQTGTGKTAGFTLPLLQLLNKHAPQKSVSQQNSKETGYNRHSNRGRNHEKRHIRALILAPTRELAAQVEESVHIYGKYLALTSTAVFGGVNIFPQFQKLRQGVDILVATPGRLLDHNNQGTVDLSHVEILVLDEADRMLDMGFKDDVQEIISLLPKNRQSLLFSATFTDEIKKFAGKLLQSPTLVETTSNNSPTELVEQIVHLVDRKRKRELLSYMIGSQRLERVLVFTRTKQGANRLSEQLEEDGIKSTAIHGNKSQGARTKALSMFKRGVVQVLVATDVASRGIDIDHLPHVINFELPQAAEDYIHRIGRTGRAGKKGTAISLVCADEMRLLRDIERLLKKPISQVAIPGYEPTQTASNEPSNHRASNRKFAPSGNRRSPFQNKKDPRRSPRKTSYRHDAKN